MYDSNSMYHLTVNTHGNRYVIGHIWIPVLSVCLKMVYSERTKLSTHLCIYANLYLNTNYPYGDMNDIKTGYKVTRLKNN